MRHLIQAELLKLRTTRSFLLYIAAAVAFVPVTVALAVTGAAAGQQDVRVPLASSDGVRALTVLNPISFLPIWRLWLPTTASANAIVFEVPSVTLLRP